jgi:hypothetical protein
MSALNSSERDALGALRKGELIKQESLEVLRKKKLISATRPIELTEAGRIVCELLQEIEGLQREDDAHSTSSY